MKHVVVKIEYDDEKNDFNWFQDLKPMKVENLQGLMGMLESIKLNAYGYLNMLLNSTHDKKKES